MTPTRIRLFLATLLLCGTVSIFFAQTGRSDEYRWLDSRDSVTKGSKTVKKKARRRARRERRAEEEKARLNGDRKKE